MTRLDATPGFETIREHYEQQNLTGSILAALRATGIDPEHLTTDDLAPIDQFHIGGKAATLELLRLAGIEPGSRILDAGGGIGGPARTLASSLDCIVVVLDLSESFCEAGAALTELTGLGSKVTFLNGNIVEIPLKDHSFDVVWTQHSSMNIDDKARMYGEFFRVLQPGGKLALHEVVAGSNLPLRFPVPWASAPESSFLLNTDAFLSVIASSGFRAVHYRDVSEEAIAFWQRRVANNVAVGTTPLLGIHLLLGPQFEEMGKNIMQNIVEERTRVVQGVFVRE